MITPDTCPACGAIIHRRETSGTRLYFACGSWMNERSEKPTWRSDNCWDKQAIREAAAIIRAFLDGDRDASEKGQDWIAENTP